LIKCLQKYNIKSNEECKQLFTQLINTFKSSANQRVYENSKKRIEKGDMKESEEIDVIVNNVINGIWSEQGLKCDNPEQKINEIASLGGLWWPINGVIDNLKILKKYNRLEL
jgi:hypothetical protein